jgi:CRISPR/Cas system endoribonuclease Cas6 (RAMP superfamily)
LNQHFGDGEPKLDYTGLVARAHEVKIERADLRWFDWKRYSNRQEQSMLMGGMIGEITYRGDLTEFLPLLRYCEKVHLGKATTFGLGQIQVCL